MSQHFTIHYSLFTIHYSLFTIHYSLFTIHYSPLTVHGTGGLGIKKAVFDEYGLFWFGNRVSD